MKRTITQLILSALLLVGVTAAYVFWQHLIEKTHADVIETNGKIATIEQKRLDELAAATGADTKDSASELVEAHALLPEDIVPFLEALESLGTEFGTTIEVVSVSDASPDGHISISLAVSGSFAGVMKTLGVIEHAKHVIVAQNLTLDAEAEGTWRMVGTVLVATQTP